MEDEIRLDRLTEQNWPLTMAWRSNPEIYQGFYQQTKPLAWGEHISWLKGRNKDWRNFLVIYRESWEDLLRPIGVVTIGQLDHWSPEIGYYIGEVSLWGRGLGKRAVQLGLDYLESIGKEYVHTTILDTNERSVSLIRSLGFRLLGNAREGESWYHKEL